MGSFTVPLSVAQKGQVGGKYKADVQVVQQRFLRIHLLPNRQFRLSISTVSLCSLLPL